MRVTWIVLGVLVLGLLFVAGCGGSDSDPNTIRQGSGSITSSDDRLMGGAHADDMAFTATRSGRICVDMNSSEVNSLVLVWEGTASDFDANTLIGIDDNSGTDLDARVVFNCTKNMTYHARFTTAGSSDFGSYKYHIHYVEGNGHLAETADSRKPSVSVELLHRQ